MPNSSSKMKATEMMRFVVKIMNNGVFSHSGVLWKPDEDSERAYVFTAPHNVINENDEYEVILWDGEKEIPFTKVKAFRHMKATPIPSKENEVLVDAAVLVINDSNVPTTKYEILSFDDLKRLREEAEFKIWGYPKELIEYTSNMSEQIYDNLACAIREGAVLDKSSLSFPVKYSDPNLSSNNNDANDLLGGMSGGGLFAYLNETLFLCGIHRGAALGSKVSLSFLKETSVEAFKEICEGNGLDIPKFQPIIPSSLKGYIKDCEDTLKDPDNDQILLKYLDTVVKWDFSTIIRDFCTFCEPCKCDYKKHFYLCKNFKLQLLESCALLLYHHGKHGKTDINGDESFYVHGNNDRQHKVRVLCCDPNNRTINQLIRSLKIFNPKNDDWQNRKPQEDSFVLWLAEGNIDGDAASCTFDEYKNIVASITNPNPNQDSYTNINDSPQNLALISVPYIVNKIKRNTDEFENFIRGYNPEEVKNGAGITN